MKYLEYLFYRLYSLMISVGNKDVAEYYAVLLMSMLVSLNIISISAFIYVLTGKQIDWFMGSKTKIFIEIMILAFIFYSLFVKSEKYLTIEKKYKNEPYIQKKNGFIFVVSYIAITVFMIVIGFYFMMKKNRGEL